ncbi:serine/threonine protein kinase [Streptomyces sp. SDr-06]|uniref:class IV lanthionine synthetase LanL n=1 Tax=Streptomyces sp. SDr-06 TaxID=2267702 RepID=UPI000DEBE83D|nr:class IV lanthionine synthetase LanL [Streptomyces sp. SDr-06]RCH64454.1 serine/threonine protein kinase [Streptomyces sp. SDr-06]
MTVDDLLLIDCAQAALARHDGLGWQARPDTFWCYVEPPGGRSVRQGWKLHLSATPLSAPLVLARAADVLLRRTCPFKFAKTLAEVEELGSRLCNRGTGGKFLTAYPECDQEELGELAEELHRATAGLPGPGILSDRPYRPGSLVHYRFGVFTGVPMLGNDGSYEAMLIAPDGRLVPDERKAWFSPPSWASPDPFHPLAEAAPTVPRPVLLDGRYLVRKVIRHAFTGGVFLGSDQMTGAEVVIKQARAHTGAGLDGQDIRDRRRHEAELLARFAPSGRTPHPVGVFEQQGDLFLVQESLPGVSLRQWVRENLEPDDGGAWGGPVSQLRDIASELVNLLRLVQDSGFVTQDFTPDNVMILANRELRLIDLEQLAEPGTQVKRSHTPAYAAPERLGAPPSGSAPAPSAALYSLGATLFYLVSGADPALPPDEPQERTAAERIAHWLQRIAPRNAAARLMAPVIVALMDAVPQRRPGLDAVRALLVEAEGPEARPTASRIGDHDLDRLISDGFAHLWDTMDPADDQRLWPTGRNDRGTDPLNVQHGSAGVLGALVRGCQGEPALVEAVQAAADWTARRVGREPRALPGLYFGRSGTAWALLEAGQLLGDDRLRRLAVDLAQRVPIRWPNPDVCHGTAGAGLTQLRFWEATGGEQFLARARTAAEALATAAEHGGGQVRWPIAADFASALAGVVHYGFAHGVAGVGTFLLAAGNATGEPRYTELATSAADTLGSLVRFDRGAAYWPSDDKGGLLKTNWCSGSSGIGTFLIRMWQHSGEDRHADLAVQAALAVRRSRWHMGTCQCHGLAGDGDFLLDLAELLGDKRYREWAAELAESIQPRNALRYGRMVLPDDTGSAVTAGFSTGLSGVLAFLTRLRDGGPRLWLPNSLMVGPRPELAAASDRGE